MALRKNKSVNLTGESIIKDTTAVQMTATITYGKSVSTAYTETIINSELYALNKTEVRKDIADFKQAIYELEDEA